MKSLSHVQLSATPWTAAYQAPPAMGFPRQEYWSAVPLPSPHESSGKCKIKPQWDITSRLLELHHQKDKCWWGCGEKATPGWFWCECKLAQPLQKKAWSFLRKTKTRITLWSSNFTSGNIAKGNENSKLKGVPWHAEEYYSAVKKKVRKCYHLQKNERAMKALG